MLELDGAHMRYSDSGARPPLLLVHGFPLDRALWKPQIAAFGDDRRVLAPDLVGFGESSAEGRPSMAAHADDLLALLDALGIERALLCGLSMGGYVALDFAHRYPERLAGLVLACTRAEPDDEAGRAGRRETADRVRDAGLSILSDAMPDKLLAEGATEKLKRELAQMIGRQPVEGTVAALGAMADRPDARPWLPGIHRPCLVLAGAEDRVIPPEASRSMAEVIPDSQLVLIPGAGHLANLEQPGAFNAALREFMARVDRGPSAAE